MKSAVETSMNCLTKAMTAVEGTPLENFYWPIFKHLSKYKNMPVSNDYFKANVVGAALFQSTYNWSATRGGKKFQELVNTGYLLTPDDEPWAFLSPVTYLYNYLFVKDKNILEWLPLYSQYPELLLETKAVQRNYKIFYLSAVKGISLAEASYVSASMADYNNLRGWLEISRDYLNNISYTVENIISPSISSPAQYLLSGCSITLPDELKDWVKSTPADSLYGYVYAYLLEKGNPKSELPDFVRKYKEFLARNRKAPITAEEIDTGLDADLLMLSLDKGYWRFFKFFSSNWNSVKDLPVGKAVKLYVKVTLGH